METNKNGDLIVDRLSIINYLENRFFDIYNGDAINISTITDQVSNHIRKGIKLNEIQLSKIGNVLMVGILKDKGMK